MLQSMLTVTKKTDESNLITGYWGKKLYDPQER